MNSCKSNKLFWLLLLALTLNPVVALARKKAKVNQPAKASIVRVPLTVEQTQLFDSLYFEALSSNMRGDVASALDNVNQALAVDSLSAPALYLRSKLYCLSKNPLSLRDIELAAKIDTANYWYGMELGDQYLDRGRFDLAIPSVERVHRLNPTKSEPCLVLAELYLRADSLTKCLAMLDRIEELDGVNPNLTLQKFYILQSQGRSDDAFAEYDKLIKRYPYDISYRIRLGDLQMKYGMIPQAKATYDAAAKIDPDDAYLWIAQSNYYSITGNQLAADTLVHQALLNAKLDISTKIDILTEYLKTTLRKVTKEKQTAQDTTAIDLPGVDSLFLMVENMHPSAPEVFNLHADYLNAIDRDSLAAVQMHFAVDLRPSDRKYWSKLLTFQAQAKDFDALFRSGKEARRQHPSLPDIYMTEAYAYAVLDKQDSVAACYEEALQKIDKTDASQISRIYGFLGDAYQQLNRIDDAYASYEQALKYNEKNYYVLNNYAYFLAIQGGDLNKAESMAAKVVLEYPDEPTYLDTYAWIYYLQGNYLLAKFYQQRAVDKSGDNPSADMVLHYDAIMRALEGDNQ